MKKNSASRTNFAVPYPNAAEPRYFLNKFIDALLAVAASAGTFTILFFLMTM